MQIDVVDAPDSSRYEARIGGELAGFAEYRRRPDAVVITHTEVLPEFEGKGVGGVLVRGALDDIRAAGGQVVPVCPFTAAYIRKHPEYLDLVAPRARDGA